MKFWDRVTRNCETCLWPLIPVHPAQTRHPNSHCDPDPSPWWDWDTNQPARSRPDDDPNS